MQLCRKISRTNVKQKCLNEEVQDDQERWTDKEWEKKNETHPSFTSGINNDQKRHVNLHMTCV